MRLSELSNKEVIDIDHGERLGMMGQADLMICSTTGKVDSFLLKTSSFLGWNRSREEHISIPWEAVHKVGPEMIIVQLRQRKRGTME